MTKIAAIYFSGRKGHFRTKLMLEVPEPSRSACIKQKL